MFLNIYQADDDMDLVLNYMTMLPHSIMLVYPLPMCSQCVALLDHLNLSIHTCQCKMIIDFISQVKNHKIQELTCKIVMHASR